MGDVVSSHLDEGRREVITARTRDVMKEFGSVYQQQYAVALFNSVRYEIEGGGGAQSQLLHRKDPLAGRSIFSGSLFQYLEENRKWRNRFVSVPNSYTISLHESKTAHERGLHPKGTINCAGYKALTSMEEYIDLINTSLPDVKAKSGSNPFIKCATQFPLILWHPYARHHYFCVTTEKEQKKWHAVLQDCVRHSNNGLSEDCTVQTPAFTDSVRLHRQAKGHYGTWDMMCGTPPQILANLVMESLHPELRSVIAPRLRGKMQQRQKHWMLISDALYRQVLSQTTSQYEALAEACEALRAPLDGGLRTDMDQIIASKEHVSSKMRALVLPKAEQLLRTNVQPYISSILEALMEPSSRGFSEVREVFFRELVEISKNLLNGGGKDKLGDPMERLSMLALHPVKMQSCYEKVEQLNLEGLQQRFDLASPSVFVSRAQTLMGQQMDNAVYTFEQLLNQSLETQGEDDMCKTIQRCQDRVLKKYDYDSSTVRKKFFRESLLQIIIPYMLQQLSPSCSPELPRFKELIFEDFSRFLLVENLFEEVVLQCVSKDIMMAVKEAAVQRRHNLYRDSIILSNSDPNLHLLEESPQVDWAAKFGGDEPEGPVGDGGESEGGGSGSRRRQVVSMIQLDGIPLSFESCMEVPGVEIIPEEDAEASEEPMSPDSVTGIRDLINPMVKLAPPVSKESPSDMTNGIEPTTGTVTWEDGEQDGVTHVTPTVEGGEQDGVTHVTPTVEDGEQDGVTHVTPTVEGGEQDGVTHVTPTVEDGEQDGVTHVTPTVEDGEQDGVTHVTPTVEDGEQDGVTHVTPTVEDGEQDGVTHVTPTVEDGEQDGVTHVTTTLEDVPRTPPPDKTAPQPVVEQPVESVEEEADGEHQEEAAIKNAIEEREIAVQEDDSGRIAEGSAAGSDCEPSPAAPQASDSSSRSDSGFQSPSSVGPDEGELQPITNGLEAEDKVIDPVEVEVVLV